VPVIRSGKTLAFAAITIIFGYTTIANIVERPDGVKIAGCFIAGIITVSLLSRLYRAFDLRITDVETDPVTDRFITDCARRTIRFIANEPDQRDEAEYRDKLHQITADNDLPDSDVIFVEVEVTDPSDFESTLIVHGAVRHQRYRVLTVQASSLPNALAALLLHIRDRTHRRPHIYFEWTEGNPAVNFLRYLLFGQGEIGTVTREMLRQHEPDRTRRPHVHAG
jgi:hypothetical protein